MRRALGLVVIPLLLAGCGGGGSSSSDDAKAARASASASHAAKVAAAKKAAFRKCQTTLGPLLQAEQQMNDRLNVGVQFSDYTSRLGDVSVAYQKAVRSLNKGGGQVCVNKVGLPLQRAFNDYRAAGNTWNHCIQNFDCSFDKGSPALKSAQGKWSKASVALTSAQSGLAAMKP